MRLRIASMDEFQFLTCFKHKLWGANKNIFKKWDIDDLLVFIVDKKITATARVTGKPFISNWVIWDSGLFEHREPIEFIHVLDNNERIPMEEVKGAFISAWGNNYGWGIVNKEIMPEDSANLIVNKIKEHQNSLTRYVSELESLLEKAKIKRDRLGNPKIKL